MDFFNEKGMFSKLKTLISSLYGITLWTSALPSPIHVPKEWPTSAHHPSGLKPLIYPPAEAPLQDQNHPCLSVHSCMIIPSSSPPSPPPPPPPPHLSSSSSSLSGNFPVAPPFQSLSHSLSFSSSSSSIMDDLIGTESGVYIKSNEFETFATTMEENQQGTDTKRSRRAKSQTKTKKYPPPIPFLAQTGNLPGHMPWILTREYRDGRLILKERRVKHHEYFEAHRGNNRLVLNLITLDSKVRCCHAVRDQHKQEKEEEIELQDPVFVDKEAAKERDEITEKEEEDNGEEVEEAAKTKDAVHEKVVAVKEMPAASSHVPNLRNLSCGTI